MQAHGRNASLHNTYGQRRTFFNLNIFTKKQEVREADMDPGIEKMMEFAKRERMRARLPPLEEMVAALRRYFDAKQKNNKGISDSHAGLVLQSLRYCRASQRAREGGAASPEGVLTEPTLIYAASALCKEAEATTQTHVELARELWENPAFGPTQSVMDKALVSYIFTLCRTSNAQQARDVVLELEGRSGDQADLGSQPTSLRRDSKVDVPATTNTGPTTFIMSTEVQQQIWPTILRGYITENNEAEVEHTLSMIDDRHVGDNVHVFGSMLDFSLKKNNPSGIKSWWSACREAYANLQHADSNEQSYKLLGKRLQDVLVWCMSHGELELGHGIVRDVMTSNPHKRLWDATFVWAAGTQKSVDQIDRMMTVMEQSNDMIPDSALHRVPDIDTINDLVEFAITKNDPYMAERFINLGRDRSIEPDSRTYVLQMGYRLDVDDVDGALTAYKHLQATDLASNEDVPTVNRLIVALCNTGRHSFDTIMNVAADLSDRRARFEQPTVSTLSLLHLKRDERDDVLDLLNTHAFHYSSVERKSIRDDLVAFSLNPKTSTARAWQAYIILKTVFDELPRTERTDLMTSFFDRNRADMGVQVFQNMRMHSRGDTLPTIDTYVAAFLGLAKLRDLENLEIIHNLLKLDFNIDTTTYLLNSLIISYTACGKARKALGFWDEIVASREGPSYNTLHAALRACEKAPFGDVRAKGIWELLRKRGVELDQALWASYAGALAGNGDMQLAIGTLEEAERNGEAVLDFLVLGSLFNGAAGQAKQAEVEAMAKEKYPEEWEKLENVKVDFDENRMRAFRIDRAIAP